MRPALRGSRGSAPGVPRKRGGASDALSSASVALANELRAPGAGALDEAEVDYRRVLQLFESIGHVNRSVVKLNLAMVELLRQLAAAGEVAGDPALADLCEQCTEKLQRGLPFVPSLHLR